ESEKIALIVRSLLVLASAGLSAGSYDTVNPRWPGPDFTSRRGSDTSTSKSGAARGLYLNTANDWPTRFTVPDRLRIPFNRSASIWNTSTSRSLADLPSKMSRTEPPTSQASPPSAATASISCIMGAEIAAATSPAFSRLCSSALASCIYLIVRSFIIEARLCVLKTSGRSDQADQGSPQRRRARWESAEKKPDLCGLDYAGGCVVSF